MIQLATRPLRSWVDHLSLTTRLVHSRATQRYRVRVPLRIETQQYVVKTADSIREIDEVLKLRHQVFFVELQGKRKWFGIELDELDFKCDHLLIIDRATQEIIGTYRLICSEFSDRFYSEGEFSLGALKSRDGVKLELGRLCIREDHRNGSVMQLLWRGVTEYMKKTGARYLLGCSSVMITDPLQITNLIRYLLKRDVITDRDTIRPRGKYHPAFHGVDADLLEHEIRNPSERRSPYGISSSPQTSEGSPVALPSLVESYLKAGAKLAPLPAVDLEFSCIDFFTILDRENLHPLFQRRYFPEEK